jgi:hypothetical protein
MDKRIDQIDQALNSLDGMAKATPAPYLMTRINARLQQQRQQAGSFWSYAVAFLSKPTVAVIGLVFFVAVNVVVISSGKTPGSTASAGLQNNNTDFAINVSSMYDIDNLEP